MQTNKQTAKANQRIGKIFRVALGYHVDVREFAPNEKRTVSVEIDAFRLANGTWTVKCRSGYYWSDDDGDFSSYRMYDIADFGLSDEIQDSLKRYLRAAWRIGKGTWVTPIDSPTAKSSEWHEVRDDADKYWDEYVEMVQGALCRETERFISKW